MSKKGVDNIQNIQEKISFALLVISPINIIRRAKELGMGLTLTTLTAWKQGKNLPTRSKLEQFCMLCHIELVDMYEELPEFMRLFCARNHVSPRERDLFIRKVEESQSPVLPLSSLTGQDPALTKRLFQKLKGMYIAYNTSLDNMNFISKTLVCVEAERHPFLLVRGLGPRGDTNIEYQGVLFPSRSNLQVIMEASSQEHNDFATMKLNNPSGMATEVLFLHGILLATAEDSNTYPGACKIYLERVSADTNWKSGLKWLKKSVPNYCPSLIDNKVSNGPGDYVLASTALNRADLERLKAQYM